MMRIQKKQFLSNLAKIKNVKQKHVGQSFLHIFRISHALVIIYFIAYHTLETENGIFSSFQQIHQYLSSVQNFPYFLSAILILVCLLIMGPLIFLSQKENKRNCDSKKLIRYQILLPKVSAPSSIFFDLFAPILLVMIASDLQITTSTSIWLHIIHFTALAFSELVIIYCKQRILFTEWLIPLLLSFMLPVSLALCLILVGAFYHMRIEQQCPPHQITYYLIVTVSVFLLIGEQTQTSIGMMHLTVIVGSTVLIVFIPNFDSVFSTKRTTESDNDYLLETVEKLDRDEELSYQQSLRLIAIIQNMKIQHKICSEINRNLEKLCSLSNGKIPKKTLIQILQAKIEIDLKEDPNNLLLMIQRFQCDLMEKQFSISTLYEIQKLSARINIQNIFKETVKLESLIKKIQATFHKSQDEIDNSVMLNVEKQSERFYMCIGESIQELLALWKLIALQKVNENIFRNSLQRIIELEEESIHLLNEIKQYRDVSSQANVFNHWHRVMNISSGSYFEYQQQQQLNRYFDTKFILVSNNTIEDVSHSIAKQITFDQPQSLFQTRISSLFYDFYNIFLHKQFDNLVSTSDNPKEMMVPFRIIDHSKMFLPCSCTFKIFPSINQGVKYVINFIDKKEDKKNFILYCLETDTVEGFSVSFFKKYKIDEDILPQVISGQQLFSIIVSAHITDKTLKKGMAIKCDLKLNDLRKQTKLISQWKCSFSLTLTINDVYSVKGINYILFELSNRQNTTIMTANETIQHFVSTAQHNIGNTATHDLENDTFCRIRNPLESVIEDKLSRIGSFSRLSYFKVAVALVVLMVLLLTAILIYVKIDTAAASGSFSNQMTVAANTNTLVQTMYLLFYQYYQYYQLINYPQQLLQIQAYNINAIALEYKGKVIGSIQNLLSLILTNQNPSASESYSINYQKFNVIKETDLINFVDFLQSAKQSLTTNSPTFLVKNENVLKHIVDSLVPLNTVTLKEFQQRIEVIQIFILVFIIFLCLLIKYLHFKISAFTWKILDVYSEISAKQVEQYSRKLQQFIDVLVRTKYYDKREVPLSHTQISLQKRTSKNLLEDQEIQLMQNPSQISDKQKGIKKECVCNDLILKNNFIFILPISIAIFFFFYHNLIENFTSDCQNVLEYSSELGELSARILEAGLNYFQTAMMGILPIAEIIPMQKQVIFEMGTELSLQLPSYFQNYKNIENGMLNFNMCTYSYLNTGSLYKGINCSKILDGMMNKGFSETYAFLLQKIDDYGGIPIQDIGNQFRPLSKYPFFMEINYARRTISNMLGFIQTQFNAAVGGFFSFWQEKLELATGMAFILLFLGLILLWFLSLNFSKDCVLAIKCFRILPRSFIMKIGISKKLKQIGVLKEIELVAA